MSRRLISTRSLPLGALHLLGDASRSAPSEPEGELAGDGREGADGGLALDGAEGFEGADGGLGLEGELDELAAWALLIPVRIGLQYAAPIPSPKRFSAARRVSVSFARFNLLFLLVEAQERLDDFEGIAARFLRYQMRSRCADDLEKPLRAGLRCRSVTLDLLGCAR